MKKAKKLGLSLSKKVISKLQTSRIKGGCPTAAETMNLCDTWDCAPESNVRNCPIG